MTENKRLIVDEDYNIVDTETGEGLDDSQIFDLVNSLSEENEQLKQQKARYKRLSEIKDEEINNRILTIKEFIDNFSNEEVKKALEDLFYSEVNEYDLSKKYRKLHEENEDLKQINRNLGDFRNFITEKNISNEKQRKELQLQMLRLYNYFENYFEDTMSFTAFSEMWDNVKEDEKWEKR